MKDLPARDSAFQCVVVDFLCDGVLLLRCSDYDGRSKTSSQWDRPDWLCSGDEICSSFCLPEDVIDVLLVIIVLSLAFVLTLCHNVGIFNGFRHVIAILWTVELLGRCLHFFEISDQIDIITVYFVVDLCGMEMNVESTSITDSSQRTSIVVHFHVYSSVRNSPFRFPICAERNELGVPLDRVSCRYVSVSLWKLFFNHLICLACCVYILEADYAFHRPAKRNRPLHGFVLVLTTLGLKEKGKLHQWVWVIFFPTTWWLYSLFPHHLPRRWALNCGSQRDRWLVSQSDIRRRYGLSGCIS